MVMSEVLCMFPSADYFQFSSVIFSSSSLIKEKVLQMHKQFKRVMFCSSKQDVFYERAVCKLVL